MILRSLSKHVKDQNWFAVALDFLIVVVGVFIGIQVSNWNAALAEDDLAKSYISQLTEDISADIIDIDTGYRTSEWRLAALTSLLEKAGIVTIDESFLLERKLTIPKPPTQSESITYLMNAMTYTRFLDNDRPAYVSLVNSGNSNLIDRLKPWPCIQSYYAQYQEVRLFEERLLLFRTDLVRNLHDAGVSIAGHLPEQETLDRIRNSAPLAGAMSSNRLFVYYHMVVLDELRNRATILLESLKVNQSSCNFVAGSL